MKYVPALEPTGHERTACTHLDTINDLLTCRFQSSLHLDAAWDRLALVLAVDIAKFCWRWFRRSLTLFNTAWNRLALAVHVAQLCWLRFGLSLLDTSWDRLSLVLAVNIAELCWEWVRQRVSFEDV